MKQKSPLRIFRDSISAKEGKRVTQGEFAKRLGVSLALINAVERGDDIKTISDNLATRIYLTFGVWIKDVVNADTPTGELLRRAKEGPDKLNPIELLLMSLGRSPEKIDQIAREAASKWVIDNRELLDAQDIEMGAGSPVAERVAGHHESLQWTEAEDAECKRRAQFLHDHGAPKDWIILTTGEVAELKAENDRLRKTTVDEWDGAAADKILTSIESLHAQIDKLKSERDAAIKAIGDMAGRLGEAEGKLLASETFQVLDGWIKRAERAENELAESRLFSGQAMEKLQKRNRQLDELRALKRPATA